MLCIKIVNAIERLVGFMAGSSVKLVLANKKILSRQSGIVIEAYL